MIPCPARFRRLVGRYTTGVAVALTHRDGRPVGMTVNSFTSVSLDPLLVLFCVRNDSRTAQALTADGRFTVTLLSADQKETSAFFAGRRELPTPAIRVDADGFATLNGCNAVFRCRLEATHPGGDHQILVARVLDMDGPDQAHAPLLYHEGRYASLAA